MRFGIPEFGRDRVSSKNEDGEDVSLLDHENDINLESLSEEEEIAKEDK